MIVLDKDMITVKRKSKYNVSFISELIVLNELSNT